MLSQIHLCLSVVYLLIYSTRLLSWLKFLAMFIRHLSHPLTFMQLEQTGCTVLMELAFGIVIVVH